MLNRVVSRIVRNPLSLVVYAQFRVYFYFSVDSVTGGTQKLGIRDLKDQEINQKFCVNERRTSTDDRSSDTSAC